jgi:hypothetical protein
MLTGEIFSKFWNHFESVSSSFAKVAMKIRKEKPEEEKKGEKGLREMFRPKLGNGPRPTPFPSQTGTFPFFSLADKRTPPVTSSLVSSLLPQIFQRRQPSPKKISPI